MQRYFVEPGNMIAEKVTITGDDVSHITKVMRSSIGDKLICCNGLGRCVMARIEEMTKEYVSCTVVEEMSETRELPVHLTLAQGLPKGDKMDWIIQKGTELGVFAILPFRSSRTIVQLDQKKEEKRIDRWSKIAKEAAEQSHRNRVPEIHKLYSWKQLLAEGQSYDLVLFAFEKEDGLSVHQALTEISREHHPSRILLIVGPEGGFSDEEAREASAAGFRSVMLGRRILRTETAGLYGLACVSYFYEQLGGGD
jgi:16S rRNA (uracil1498-N3)-methyltransferase